MVNFTPEENKQYWNQQAQKLKDNPYGTYRDKNMVELENHFIENELKSRKINSLLDIGCGNGQRTLLFSKYSKNTLGIDYSEKQIEQAKELVLKHKEIDKNNISFEINDINSLDDERNFDVIISCRCITNQPSYEIQIKLFEALHKKLNSNGSLIIVEGSQEGLERLDGIRKSFGLDSLKVLSQNLPIKESVVFPKLESLFKINRINRLGMFFYISRVIYPALVYPEEPKPDAKINTLAKKAEIMYQPTLEKKDSYLEDFGTPLFIHFIKK